MCVCVYVGVCRSILYKLATVPFGLTRAEGRAARMKVGRTKPRVRRADDYDGARLTFRLCLEPLSLRETA